MSEVEARSGNFLKVWIKSRYELDGSVVGNVKEEGALGSSCRPGQPKSTDVVERQFNV